MDYSEEEIKIINKSFEKSRMDFDHDQDITNPEDVIRSLNLHRDRYFMNGDDEQIAIKIFEKHGLWKDGFITIEAHDQAELKKKVESALRFKQAREKQLARLKDLKNALENSIQKLEEEPKRITNDLYEKRKKLQAQAYDRLDEVSKKMQEHLKETAERLTEEFNQEKSVILNDLKDDIEQLKLQERNEIDNVLKEYDELMKLKQEYDKTELEYREDVERLEIKDQEIESSLFDLTVRELKEIADNKGIEYPTRIVKADLVDLIENDEDNKMIEE